MVQLVCQRSQECMAAFRCLKARGGKKKMGRVLLCGTLAGTSIAGYVGYWLGIQPSDLDR